MYVTCNLTYENSAAREAHRKRHCWTMGSIIKSSTFMVSAWCDWLLTTILSRKLSSLYNFGSDHRENTAPSGSSIVSPPSPCLCVYPPIVVRQWLGKYVPMVRNTHATVEELLDASFSMWFMWYQRKVSDYFLLELLVSHPVMYNWSVAACSFVGRHQWFG
jgi:hypothetical protein